MYTGVVHGAEQSLKKDAEGRDSRNISNSRAPGAELNFANKRGPFLASFGQSRAHPSDSSGSKSTATRAAMAEKVCPRLRELVLVTSGRDHAT